MALIRTPFLLLLLAGSLLSFQNPFELVSTSLITGTTTRTTSQEPATSIISNRISSTQFTTDASTAGKSIYVKTAVSGCNVQGTANSSFRNRFLNEFQAADILQCQHFCQRTTACAEYSFNTSSTTEGNCLLYSSGDDNHSDVAKGKTGVFFSKKNLNDGSDHCYSDAPISIRVSETIKSHIPSLVLEERSSPSPTPTLYIKSNASDCNIEGSMGSAMQSSNSNATATLLNSVLDCQQLCQRNSTCYSYSWQAMADSACKCTLYSTWMLQTPGAVDVGDTGVWFSDKYVVDGTLWCYSSTPFLGSGLPSGPLIIT
ncbi:hypothetical protein EG329_008958 [Mollisiaceae sp. DMI_Dod_QoI]|nr:hypothetical protein EG329_008958 [Helotiales sp. DMI_Dod_QoI]